MRAIVDNKFTSVYNVLLVAKKRRGGREVNVLEEEQYEITGDRVSRIIPVVI